MAKSAPTRLRVVTAIQFAAAMAIILWPGCGWAQSEGQATVEPSFYSVAVGARSEPAKVTTEEESALISKGYVQIGTIRASRKGKKENPDIAKQLESAILQKAAEAGGDLVRFSKEGELESTEVEAWKSTLKCERTITVYYQPGNPAGGSYKACAEYSSEDTYHPKKETDLFSEGTIWRYDPNSDIARTEEAWLNASRKTDDVDYKSLDEALAKEDYAEAESLLAHGANVNARNSYGGTELEFQAGEGNRHAVELLLAHGADVNAKDRLGDTPLHKAAGWGKREVAEVLLAHGADVNARGDQGFTPLHTAAYDGYRDVVELLLAHGADVNTPDIKGNTPLHDASAEKHKDIVKLLRQHGGHE
jgi:hypothetical protein